jgi:predicted extracellular nuclease
MLRRSSCLALLALGAASAAVLTGAPPTAAAPGGDGLVFVNELHYDNAGADAGEAVEVAAPAGTDLGGWSIVLYNGSGGAPYNTVALSGVVADQANGWGTIAVPYPANGVQNGAPDGLALVDPGGVAQQFLSYEGAFAAVGGPANGLASADIGVAEDGAGAAGTSLQLTGAGDSNGDFVWAPAAAQSFGAPNAGQSFNGAPPPPPPPPPCPDAPAVTPIGQLQGAADVSPCVARVVVVEGVVVGDYEGPAPALRGFYVQEQDDQLDADSSTSDGVFVFNANNNSVELGQVVTVTGSVSEFQSQTQVSATSVVVSSSGAAVTPASVALPLASPAALEAVEGMLVTVAQELTVTEHFLLGRFGEVVVSGGGRLPQPTTVAEPGADAQAVAAANSLNRLKVDDAGNGQNPDPIVLGRGGQPTTAANPLRGGDTVTGLTGVLTYTWAGNNASPNAYRLRPIGDLSDVGLVAGGVSPEFVAANPRPAGPPAVGGDVKVASFNVLNYFLTLDDNSDACGPDGAKQECRGAESPEEFTRQRDKLLTAVEALDASVLGLIELENTPGVDPAADIAAGLNQRAGAPVWSSVDTGVIGSDTIRVGTIYRNDVVQTLGPSAIIDATVDPRFDSTRNRPSLAQSFVDSGGEVFTVVTSHLKSKGCGDDAAGADADSGDGQGCWNASRASAAAALVDWVASRPTGVADDDVVLVGDFNSYAKEQPIDVLAAAGYADLVASSSGESSYSFVFDGQWGSLDFAFASPSLAAQVTGADKFHINADEPSVLDFNTNFKSPAQLASLYAPDQFRTSDHDPVLVGLDLGVLAPTVRATPSRLWLPTQRLRRVDITAVGGSGTPLTATITGVTSSEADSGINLFDRPGDIELVDADSLRLRAEVFDCAGRTYTIGVAVTDGAQTVYATTEVRVPALFLWWCW